MQQTRISRTAFSLLLGASILFGIGGCATHSDADAWPAKVIPSDQLRLAEPLRLKMPRRASNDPMPNGTTVLRLHVDEQGTVRKTSLATSSGSATMDSAAAQAFNGARFVPYREAGTAVAVTTLMPVNVKASVQCRGFSLSDC